MTSARSAGSQKDRDAFNCGVYSLYVLDVPKGGAAPVIVIVNRLIRAHRHPRQDAAFGADLDNGARRAGSGTPPSLPSFGQVG